jgi:hypothetical protein
MFELSLIAQPLRIWLEGGTIAEIVATPGFGILLLLAAVVIVPSLILLGIGHTNWHDTPLGRWFGAKEPDQDWKYRAGDVDKDGLIDF